MDARSGDALGSAPSLTDRRLAEANVDAEWSASKLWAHINFANRKIPDLFILRPPSSGLRYLSGDELGGAFRTGPASGG
jgi:hypothetical protein